MQRREFIQLSLAGSLAGVALPMRMAAADAPAPSMAGGVYYTLEQPGRWKEKAAGHAPKLEKTQEADGSWLIKVVTDHPMKGFEHYIVKHQLLDKDYRFVAEKMFDPDKDAPKSEFRLPKDYQGMVHAISMCNKHDLWLSSLAV